MSKQKEETPQEILSICNTNLQHMNSGVLMYNQLGHDCIIAAMVEYGRQQYEKGKRDALAERNQNA